MPNILKGFVSIMEITIEDILIISENSFYGCSGLVNVNLPLSLKTIRNNAFYNCENAIYNYDNLDNLETIGSCAFYNNKNLVSIIANNICSIDNNAFFGCNNLQEITLQNGKIIGELFGEINYENSYQAVQNENTYYLPISLNRVYISSKASIINNYAFENCKNLSEIVLTNKIVSFGKNSFKNTGIITLIMPDSTTSIGEEAFANCKKLENIVFN